MKNKKPLLVYDEKDIAAVAEFRAQGYSWNEIRGWMRFELSAPEFWEVAEIVDYNKERWWNDGR